jgi:hypothetical protein
MIFDESSTPSLSLGVDMFSSYLTAELLIVVVSDFIYEVEYLTEKSRRYEVLLDLVYLMST